MLSLPVLLLALASNALGSPVEERQYNPQRINWRNGDQSNAGRHRLVVCGGGPYVGNTNGDKLSIAGDYFRYCTRDWRLDTSGAVTSVVNPTFNPMGKDYCLDATLNPGNGVQPHMWQCYPGAPQQNWVYRSDGLIELSGRGLCLDLTDGDTYKNVQLWACDGGNRNQQWDVANA